MKRLLLTVLVLGVAVPVLAAPALPITKPPIGPVPSWTGPINDPHAIQGQWFIPPGQYTEPPGPGETYRPYEFHDNVDPNYGGGFKSYLAIYGKVTQVTQNAGNITAFQVRTRITNDMPALSPWLPGANSHGEWDPNRAQVVMDMKGVKLTTEFAIAGLGMFPSQWASPYRQGEIGSGPGADYIVADNYDELAWYCWTPGSGLTPTGNFFVPTYDFPDIPLGQTRERTLSFHSSNPVGITPGETRYGEIMWSYSAPENDGDLFLNRTTDLKIGDWIDNLRRDTGVPYPGDPLRSGNVSVFFPEPTAVLLLGLGALLLRRR